MRFDVSLQVVLSRKRLGATVFNTTQPKYSVVPTIRDTGTDDFQSACLGRAQQRSSTQHWRIRSQGTCNKTSRSHPLVASRETAGAESDLTLQFV